MGSKQLSISYIPELDGIRCIAILLVMIFHIGNPIFKGGFIGVDIFFVLSGFLITSLLLNEYDTTQNISLRNFYIRRILRLAPALLILLISIAVLGFFLFNQDERTENLQSIFYALFYSANWVRAFNFHDMGLLSHTWSLSIEEQFYILWPCTLILLVKFTKSKKNIIHIVTLIAVASWLLRILMTYYGSPAYRIYNGLDTRVDALLTGCILALFLSANFMNFNNYVVKILVKYLAMTALLLYGFIFFNLSWSNHHIFYWAGFLIQIFTAFLILHIIISDNSLLKRFLRNKILVWIGSISYGLYLWHDPIFEIIRMRGYSMSVIAAAGISLTFIAASLSFYIAEKPILKLKSKFASGINIEKNKKEKVPCY